MPSFSAYDTQWLTRANFEPTAGRRRLGRQLLTLAAATGVALYLAAQAGLLGGIAPAAFDRAAARRQLASLSEELERANAELALERATRRELQRQADELGARVTELSQQLEFVTSRRDAAGRK